MGILFHKIISLKQSKNNQAAKIIQKKKIKSNRLPIAIGNAQMAKDENLQEALREISILKKLNHENIIRLVEILHDEDDIIYLSNI